MFTPTSQLLAAIRAGDLSGAHLALSLGASPGAEVAIAIALLSERVLSRRRQGVRFPGSTMPLLRHLVRRLDAMACPWDSRAPRISGGDTARDVIEYAIPGVLGKAQVTSCADLRI